MPALVPISVMREFTGMTDSTILSIRDPESGRLLFPAIQLKPGGRRYFHKVDLAKFCKLEL